MITRVGPTQWDAVADGRTVGRGDASRRPDGRLFLSIDAWHDSVFDRLAAVLLPELSTPLYTVVDEVDTDLRSAWERAGFTVHRREWEYFGSTDPRHTGLDSVPIPAEVRILPVGAAQEGPLLELYSTIRAEVHTVACPVGTVPIDPARCAVATRSGRYVGLLRVATRRRHARIELVAVHTDIRRRGIARALLAEVLGALHGSGIETVSAYVDDADTAAVALFDGISRRAGSNLELVRR